LSDIEFEKLLNYDRPHMGLKVLAFSMYSDDYTNSNQKNI